MIVPHQIVRQVQEGQFPATWWVIRPVPASHIGCGYLLYLFGGLVPMYLGGQLVAAIVRSNLLHQSGSGLFGDIFISGPVALLLIAIGVTMLIRRSKYAKDSRDALLILLPEGIVSCERCSDEVERSFEVIEYKDVIHIALVVKPSQYESRISLTIQYKEGSTENWRIASKYRASASIAQRIITDHLRYVELLRHQ